METIRNGGTDTLWLIQYTPWLVIMAAVVTVLVLLLISLDHLPGVLSPSRGMQPEDRATGYESATRRYVTGRRNPDSATQSTSHIQCLI